MSANKLRPGRNAQFCIFQAIGWISWVVLLILRDLTFVPAEYMLDRAGIFVLDALAGIVLSTALRYLYRLVWDAAAYLRVAAVFFGCLIASMVWQLIKDVITATEIGSSVDLTGYGWVSFFNVLPFSFSLLLVWSVLYFCIKYYQMFQIEKEKSLRSEALAHEAQLRMLRYQLNPHFLFNTLNAISTLVLQKDTESANTMLTKLSKFLRYSLDHDPLDQVDLAHEIGSVGLYLDIEKVRFEERMKIEFNIEGDAGKGQVPSMLLQPLIENSIKHAIARSVDGGLIAIHAYHKNAELVIEIMDDGPGIPDYQAVVERNSGSSGGVGLKNIRDRLKEIYGDNHSITFSKREPIGCKVTVVIPYETD
ncbi:MAG: histidine kinase [Pseudohongiellaceae bacterium]|nr:histidine kinase [Pseudohongiellaceae bacterium]